MTADGVYVVPAGLRSLSLADAGKALGLSRRSIYHRIQSGHLQTIRVGRESRRVTLQSLLECPEGRDRFRRGLIKFAVQ